MFDTHPRTPATCLIIVLLLGGAGCADDATCDEGQVLMGGSCVDVSSDEAVVDAGSGRPSVDEGFGDACADDVDHSECTDTADFCAIMPGAAEGICTAQGCAEDETVCPEGWGCLDLSAFMEGLPSICTEP